MSLQHYGLQSSMKCCFQTLVYYSVMVVVVVDYSECYFETARMTAELVAGLNLAFVEDGVMAAEP